MDTPYIAGPGRQWHVKSKLYFHIWPNSKYISIITSTLTSSLSYKLYLLVALVAIFKFCPLSSGESKLPYMATKYSLICSCIQ